MTFLEALLNILAIIGIVVVGGIVVYYLGGLFLNILDKRKNDNVQENNAVNNNVQEHIVIEEKKVIAPEQTEEMIPQGTISEEKFVLDDNEEIKSVNFEAAQEEKASLYNKDEDFVKEEPVKEPVSEVEEKSTDDVNDIFNDDKEFNFDDFDFDSFFDEQDKENQQKQAETEKKEVEEEQVIEEAIDNAVSQEIAQIQESSENVLEGQIGFEDAQVVSATPAVVNNTTNTSETTEITKTIYVENHELEDALRAEIENLKVELAEQKELYLSLKESSRLNEEKWESEKTTLEQLYIEAEEREVEKPKAVLTLEEYEARLAVLYERLKVNEKDLKQNRKEFLPLRRVRKNLDKDKSKLRRREALVAKQKVLLYGVNNIMEIDQEKAKKLAEDLDLLDGLKVSVRHCEEVMEANKERYPILETANRILTTTHEELKADIEECEKAIRELKIANGTYNENEPLIPQEEQPEKRKRGRPRKTETTEETSSNEVTKSKVVSKTEEKTVIHTADKKVETENDTDEGSELELFKILPPENEEEIETSIKIEKVEAKEEKIETPEQVIIKEEPVVREVIIEKPIITKIEKTIIEKPVVEEVKVVEEPVVTKIEENNVDVFEENTTSTRKVQKTNENISYEKTTISTTKVEQTNVEPHKFNFDADEPSFEDLFAIENEDWFDEE